MPPTLLPSFSQLSKIHFKEDYPFPDGFPDLQPCVLSCTIAPLKTPMELSSSKTAKLVRGSLLGKVGRNPTELWQRVKHLLQILFLSYFHSWFHSRDSIALLTQDSLLCPFFWTHLWPLKLIYSLPLPSFCFFLLHLLSVHFVCLLFPSLYGNLLFIKTKVCSICILSPPDLFLIHSHCPISSHCNIWLMCLLTMWHLRLAPMSSPKRDFIWA